MPKVVYYIENDDETLSHYGRLGMKWGQHIFDDGAVASRVRMARYALATEHIPKGVSRSVPKVTYAQRASVRRHDYLYSKPNIDRGKAFVASADLSSLLDNHALEWRVQAARRAMQRSGW